MKEDIQLKLSKLEAFCKKERITIELITDGFGDAFLDLNIHNEFGDLIEYDKIGHTITYL